MLTVELASGPDAIWCQQQWIEHHYLHSRIDPRCRPIAYIVFVNGDRRGIFWSTKEKNLRVEIERLRADIEHIGRERDQMIAANVELQERLSQLSRLDDDLK